MGFYQNSSPQRNSFRPQRLPRNGDTAALAQEGGGKPLTGMVRVMPDGSISLRVKEDVPRSAENPDGQRVRDVPVKDKTKLVKLIDNGGMRFKSGAADFDKENGTELASVVSLAQAMRSNDEKTIAGFRGRHFRFAKTNDALKSAGLSGDYFTIRAGVILRHNGKDAAHDITPDEWSDIADALTNKKPEIVERFGDRNGQYKIWTQAKIDGRTAIVGTEVKNIGRDIDINAVQTVFGVGGAMPKEENIVYPKSIEEKRSVLTRHNSGRYPASPQDSNSVSQTGAKGNGVSAEEDAAYMDAVRRGDVETAQRMIREAAEAKGYVLKPSREAILQAGITLNNLGEIITSAAIMKTNSMFAEDIVVDSSGKTEHKSAAAYLVSGDSIESKRFANLKDAIQYLNINGFGMLKAEGFSRSVAEWPHVAQDGYEFLSATATHRVASQIKDYLHSKRDADIASGDHIFIRFGKLPKSGKSRNYAEGYDEPGVSVFTGLKLKDGSVFVIPQTPQQLGTLLHARAQGRPVFVATGEVNGKGSDGEPTLANAKIVKAHEYTFVPPKLYVNGDSVKRADVTYDDAGNVIPLSQRFNPEKADLRFKRTQFASGKPYVQIDTDQSLFDNAKTADFPKIARKVILSRFRGKVVGELPPKNAYVRTATAGEFAYPAKPLEEPERSAKMRSAGELDNLLAVGEYAGHEKDDGRHPEATGGWDYYNTIFEVGGKFFRGKVNLLVNNRGRIFHDMTDIKEDTRGLMDQYGKPQAQFPGASTKDSVSQTGAEGKSGSKMMMKRETPAGVQKAAGVEYPDAGREISGLRFKVGAKRREEYAKMLAKHRPDLDANAVLDELDKFDEPKKEKAALHWVVRGAIRLPEDAYKVEDALSVAEKAKVDPFAYKSPLELIEAHKDIKPTRRAIDPESVPELSDRRDEGDGIVSYEVADTREGQAAMRRIIDTHWGEEANPWCLLARGNDASPEVMRAAANLYPGDPDAQMAYIERQKKRDDGLARAWNYWRHYSVLPKRVAFKNGRLLAFMATENQSEDAVDLEDRLEELRKTMYGQMADYDDTGAYSRIGDARERIENLVSSQRAVDAKRLDTYAYDDSTIREVAEEYGSEEEKEAVKRIDAYDNYDDVTDADYSLLQSLIPKAIQGEKNKIEHEEYEWREWVDSEAIVPSYDSSTNTANIIDWNGDAIDFDEDNNPREYRRRADGSYVFGGEPQEQWWDRKDESHPNLDWARGSDASGMRFKRNPAFEHSLDALQAIADGADYGILHNAKYGKIRYPKGKAGRITESGKTKEGLGLLHIVSERMRKDGATLDEALDIAIKVGQAAEIGEETNTAMNTHWLDYDGVRAIVAETETGNPIITGYEIRADETPAAFPSSDALQHRPVMREADIVAALRNRIANLRAEGNSDAASGLRFKRGAGDLTSEIKSGKIHIVNHERMTNVIRGLVAGELKHPRFTKEEVAASKGIEHERLWSFILSLESSGADAGRSEGSATRTGAATAQIRGGLDRLGSLATRYGRDPRDVIAEKGRFFDRGVESRVYLEENSGKVVKVRELKAIDTGGAVDVLANIVYHNYLFPKDAYSLQDIVVWNKDGYDRFDLILEQPFVTPKTDAGGNIIAPNEEQIIAALRKTPQRFSVWDEARDREDYDENSDGDFSSADFVPSARKIAYNDSFIVYDFKPGRNTFLDAKTGEVRFIDPRVAINDPGAGFSVSRFGKRRINRRDFDLPPSREKDGLRFKRGENERAADDTSVWFGAKASMAAHGFDARTAKEMGINITNKGTVAAARSLVADVRRMNEIITFALTSDRPLSAEENTALVILAQNLNADLGRINQMMAESANPAAFQAEKELVEAKYNKALEALNKAGTHTGQSMQSLKIGILPVDIIIYGGKTT